MATVRTTDPSYTATVELPQSPKAQAEMLLRITLNGDEDGAKQFPKMIIVTFAGEESGNIDFWMSPKLMPVPGTYEFSHAFPAPGRYRMWIEIADNTKRKHHAELAEFIGWTDFSVGGEVNSEEHSAAEEYRILMDPVSIRHGEPSALRFSLLNNDGKKWDFWDYEPFMYIITNEDKSYYRMDHGSVSRDLKTGTFAVTFPSPGKYSVLIFAEFRGVDAVHSLKERFVVEVE